MTDEGQSSAERVDAVKAEMNTASIAIQERLLNTVRSLEKFSLDFQVSIDELKRVANDAAERLRRSGEPDVPGK